MPRRILIQKSSDTFSSMGGGGAMVSRGGFGSSLGNAAFGGAVSVVTDQRKNEKREMQDLNERFAGMCIADVSSVGFTQIHLLSW